MKVLDVADLEQFVAHGWCMVRGAFTPLQAKAARAVVWRRMAQKIALDEVALRVVRCLLDGRTDLEVVRDLAGQPGAVPDEAALLARCAAVRSSIFAPLCRS